MGNFFNKMAQLKITRVNLAKTLATCCSTQKKQTNVN